MTMSPGDTDELHDRLRAERPRLDADGEARVRGTVAASFPDPPRASRRLSLGIAALLAAGLVLTGGGAAAAISGFAADTTAVNAQYSTPTGSAPVSGNGSPGSTVGVAGETESAPANTSTSPSLGTQGERNEAATTPASANAPSQVGAAADSGDTLPFTGFAAIPIVIVGALLIAVGTLLRRRTQQVGG
jgi:hypothetical protein